MKEYIYYFYPYNLSYSDSSINLNKEVQSDNLISHSTNFTLNNTIPYKKEDDFIFLNLVFWFIFFIIIFCFRLLYITCIKCFNKQNNDNNNNTLISNVILLNKEEEQICSICLLLFQHDDEISRLNCGHMFHTNCLNEWISNKKNCPLCRINI